MSIDILKANTNLFAEGGNKSLFVGGTKSRLFNSSLFSLNQNLDNNNNKPMNYNNESNDDLNRLSHLMETVSFFRK